MISKKKKKKREGGKKGKKFKASFDVALAASIVWPHLRDVSPMPGGNREITF